MKKIISIVMTLVIVLGMSASVYAYEVYSFNVEIGSDFSDAYNNGYVTLSNGAYLGWEFNGYVPTSGGQYICGGNQISFLAYNEQQELENVTVTATGSSGYEFEGWYIGGSKIADGTYSIDSDNITINPGFTYKEEKPTKVNFIQKIILFITKIFTPRLYTFLSRIWGHAKF